MISSVPRFPANVSEGFQYLIPQTRFGQIVLCVTVPQSIESKISTCLIVIFFIILVYVLR